jgi:hypothetical protein
MLAKAMRFSVRMNNDLTLPQYAALARAAERAASTNSGSATTSSRACRPGT